MGELAARDCAVAAGVYTFPSRLFQRLFKKPCAWVPGAHGQLPEVANGAAAGGTPWGSIKARKGSSLSVITASW